jgi:hypothetical protein
MKRKEIIRQKDRQRVQELKIMSQPKIILVKNQEQQVLTVRYGILESQHGDADIATHCYGMKRD